MILSPGHKHASIQIDGINQGFPKNHVGCYFFICFYFYRQVSIKPLSQGDSQKSPHFKCGINRAIKTKINL